MYDFPEKGQENIFWKKQGPESQYLSFTGHVLTGPRLGPAGRGEDSRAVTDDVCGRVPVELSSSGRWWVGATCGLAWEPGRTSGSVRLESLYLALPKD